MAKPEMFNPSGNTPWEVRYLVPDVEGPPNPKPFLAENFVTEDGRVPLYIRDEEGARSEYWKLRDHKLIPLRPGQVLSEEEFLQLVEEGRGFEVLKRNNPNDDGIQMIWTEDKDSACKFYREQQDEGCELRALALELDEGGFVDMAMAEQTIDLVSKHYDGSPKIMRGIIIGSSEGGGMVQPSLGRSLFRQR